MGGTSIPQAPRSRRRSRPSPGGCGGNVANGSSTNYHAAAAPRSYRSSSSSPQWERGEVLRWFEELSPAERAQAATVREGTEWCERLVSLTVIHARRAGLGTRSGISGPQRFLLRELGMEPRAEGGPASLHAAWALLRGNSVFPRGKKSVHYHSEWDGACGNARFAEACSSLLEAAVVHHAAGDALVLTLSVPYLSQPGLFFAHMDAASGGQFLRGGGSRDGWLLKHDSWPLGAIIARCVEMGLVDSFNRARCTGSSGGTTIEAEYLWERHRRLRATMNSLRDQDGVWTAAKGLAAGVCRTMKGERGPLEDALFSCGALGGWSPRALPPAERYGDMNWVKGRPPDELLRLKALLRLWEESERKSRHLLLCPLSHVRGVGDLVMRQAAGVVEFEAAAAAAAELLELSSCAGEPSAGGKGGSCQKQHKKKKKKKPKSRRNKETSAVATRLQEEGRGGSDTTDSTKSLSSYELQEVRRERDTSTAATTSTLDPTPAGGGGDSQQQEFETECISIPRDLTHSSENDTGIIYDPTSPPPSPSHQSPSHSVGSVSSSAPLGTGFLSPLDSQTSVAAAACAVEVSAVRCCRSPSWPNEAFPAVATTELPEDTRERAGTQICRNGTTDARDSGKDHLKERYLPADDRYLCNPAPSRPCVMDRCTSPISMLDGEDCSLSRESQGGLDRLSSALATEDEDWDLDRSLDPVEHSQFEADIPMDAETIRGLQEDNVMLRDVCLRLEAEMASMRNQLAIKSVLSTEPSATSVPFRLPLQPPRRNPPRSQANENVISQMVIPEHRNISWEVMSDQGGTQVFPQPVAPWQIHQGYHRIFPAGSVAQQQQQQHGVYYPPMPLSTPSYMMLSAPQPPQRAASFGGMGAGSDASDNVFSEGSMSSTTTSNCGGGRVGPHNRGSSDDDPRATAYIPIKGESGRDDSGVDRLTLRLRLWTVFPPTALGVPALRSRLCEDMNAFVQHVVDDEAQRFESKWVTFHRCRQLVRSLWPRAQVNLYGSFVTGLSLPSSDLDLVIWLPNVRKDAPAVTPGPLEGRNAIKQSWQKELSRCLALQGWVETMQSISQTSVPIIKLTTKKQLGGAKAGAGRCNSTSDASAAAAAPAPYSTTKALGERQSLDHPFSWEGSLSAVNVDISFDDQTHNGQASNKLLLNLIDQFPALRPLVLVLKQFLKERGLCVSYTGGLTSYAVVLMVARYLQEQNSHHDAGSLLLGFLDFYGNSFDPRSTGISVTRGCYFSRFSSPPAVPMHTVQRMYYASDAASRRATYRGGSENALTNQFDPLYIEDPLVAENNVGRNCFRIWQIKRAWSEAHSALLLAMDEPGGSKNLLSVLCSIGV